MSEIVFIGGVHGAGKGTISESICSKLALKHLSASDLIKWREISIDEKNKKVDNISNTQDRLIAGLKFAIKAGGMYLLDGHFCLLNKNNQPEKVPLETFRAIAPSIISVVTGDVNTILDRLSLRDGKDYSFETLDVMQRMEEEYAKEISSQLKIPLVIIRNGDTKELIQLITKMFQ